MSFWKDQLNTKNFWPTHNEPQLFIMSQWQPDKESPNILYFILRLAIFITFFVIWILSYTMESTDGRQKWPLYLTNWGLTLCVLQSFFVSLTLGSAFINSTDVVLVFNLYKTYWVLNTMATVVAFTISFVYWTLIHQASYWSTMNFMVHGMNSILIFIDLCVVAHPVRLLHFIYPICITTIYVTMTAIYYACGGLAKGGSKYIYPILKCDELGKTLLYCVAIVIFITLIHSVTFFFQLLRTMFADWCLGVKEKQSVTDQAEMGMLTH